MIHPDTAQDEAPRLRKDHMLPAGTPVGSRIREITTVRSDIQPNVLHVLVTDTDGVTGLGETFYGAGVVEAHIHQVIAPSLRLDQPSTDPAEVKRVVTGYVGYSGSGAEVRAQSAIDIALWDIAAKKLRQPLRHLFREDAPSTLPVYNTCSGANYVNAESRQSSSNWGIGDASPAPGTFEDLWGFLNRPGDLAKELVAEGYRGMKVWPFDVAAEIAQGGPDIDLSFGLRVLDAIRESVGDSIDLYVEMHSLLGLDAAVKLASELQRYDLTWFEDPIRGDSVGELVTLKESTSVPIAVGENIGAGRNGYRPLIENRAVDTLIADLGWCGGISEGLNLTSQTSQANLRIAYHDCTGPVSLAVAGELAAASPNSDVQEVARAFWHTWYPLMAEGIPDIRDGHLWLGDRPGHGVTLSPDFLERPGTVTQTSVVTSR
jgi:L-alanine-DL-glutamate epimerase-like enolase superfamily enzyme